MKKLFTLVAMAFVAMGVNAQSLVAERDWTGVAEYDLGFFQDGESGATYEMVADGISITTTQDMGEGNEWKPQMSVLQGFDLAEDVTYKVVITAKFPASGNLQVNMGDWSTNKQYVVPVEATGDFQEVEVEFPDFPGDATNAHVLFQPGRIVGNIILKKVQVFDMTEGEGEGDAYETIFERDWTGVAEYDYGFFQDGESGATYEMVADGISITTTQDMGEGNEWKPQMSVLQGFDLAEDETYIVRVNAKFPASGNLQINMGDWSTNKQYVVPVEATGDFQDVDVEFPDFPGDATNAHVLFQPGRIVGNIILKKVAVLHQGGDPTGIKTLKNNVVSDVRYNLAGQKVDANYKGVVIMNGKKFMQK